MNNTAKDSMGRSTGRRFNMAAMKRDILAKQSTKETEIYHGFKIERPVKLVFVSGDPRTFKSIAAAKSAIDACLETRALVA